MIYLTVSTKGGVGKSTVSSQLLATYLYEKHGNPVKYIEVDDQNENVRSLHKSEIIEPVLVSTELVAQLMEQLVIEDQDVIVDVGGNLTSKLFLERLDSMGGFIADVVYFIPLLDGEQDAQNAKDTFNMIRQFDNENKIVFVLNRCSNKNNEDLLNREFMDFFGNDVLGVDGIGVENYEFLALNHSAIYKVTGKVGKTILELSKDDYQSEYKIKAKEHFKDKENIELYKEVRRLMFLNENSRLARKVINEEYQDLYSQIDALATVV